MACEENFCQDYLVLNPKEAGFWDLLRIFYSSELEKRDFFDTPVADRLGGFSDRWLVFVSVVGQKLLLKWKKPMADMGYMMEQWLNYPTSNGGFGRLILNFLTGSYFHYTLNFDVIQEKQSLARALVTNMLPR